MSFEHMSEAFTTAAPVKEAAGSPSVGSSVQRVVIRGPSRSGGKACSQCGATRTPQWREGPMGPKTLCNACGVRLQRQLKAAGKSRVTKVKKVVPQEPVAAQHVGSSHDVMMTLRKPAGWNRSPYRPVRKAAARAAELTAEYAMTGDWQDGVDGDVGRDDYAPKRQRVGESHDSRQDSDTAEEVAWTPLRMPATTAVHADTAAAVDLLSMSIASPDMLADADVMVDIADLKQQFERLEGDITRVPVHLRLECMALKDMLEGRQQAAMQARAAMASIAKLFAAKQAVCIQANSAVMQAAARLRNHIKGMNAHIAKHSVVPDRHTLLQQPQQQHCVEQPCSSAYVQPQEIKPLFVRNPIVKDEGGLFQRAE